MDNHGPPDPFLDRPGSLPAVPWVQWIRDFELFLGSRRCEEEEKNQTLMLHLGQEGRRILLNLPDPTYRLLIQTDPPQWRRCDGTDSYEQLVRALTAHYEREASIWGKIEKTWNKILKILMKIILVSAALVFMARLYQGKVKEAVLMAVCFAVIFAVFFYVMVPVYRLDSWNSWWFRVRWWFLDEFPDVFLPWFRGRDLFVPRRIEERFQDACTLTLACILAVAVAYTQACQCSWISQESPGF